MSLSVKTGGLFFCGCQTQKVLGGRRNLSDYANFLPSNTWVELFFLYQMIPGIVLIIIPYSIDYEGVVVLFINIFS